MPIAEQKTPKSRPPSIGPAEAFYALFRSLPKNEKMALAKYILEDDEVRQNAIEMEIPNNTTLNAFEEDQSNMPVFTSIEALRKDLLS